MNLEGFIKQTFHITDTKGKIMKNLFWAVLGKVVMLAGGLFVGVLVARYLGPEQYGLMNYVISYVFLFQTIALFGLDSIEVREEARAQKDMHAIIGTAFYLKLMLAVAAIAASLVTAAIMESDCNTIVMIAIYALSIIPNSFTVVRNYFTAIVDNEYVVKSEIARTLMGMGIKVILLLFHAPLIAFIAASAFDFFLLASGYAISYSSRIGSIREWTFDKHYAVFLMKESFPLLLTNAAVIIYQRIDQVMIGQMIDNASVGFFSVASRIVEILIFIPSILAHTIAPILVKAREESVTDYEMKSRRFMSISIYATLALSLATSLLAHWVILLLFGKSYLPAVIVLQILSFKAVSVALSNSAGCMLVAEGLQRYAICRDALGCIVCITLNLILLPRYGIVAAAWVAILSNIAAGYVADLFIPSYRHLFRMQSYALFCGWKELFKTRQITQ